MSEKPVPQSARINPGERKFVVGLWMKYTRQFQLACQTLNPPELAKLVEALTSLENVYLANWSQVAHAVEMVNVTLAAYNPWPQLPARCLTSEIREQVDKLIGIHSRR